MQGAVVDAGTILGDSYDLYWELEDGTQIAHAGGNLGSQFAGNQSSAISSGGISPDAETKWQTVKTSGIKVRFEVTVDPTLAIDATITAFALVIVAIFAGGSKKSCSKVHGTVTPPAGAL